MKALTLLYEKIEYSECEKSLIKIRDYLQENGFLIFALILRIVDEVTLH